jgi:hypothetical protein
MQYAHQEATAEERGEASSQQTIDAFRAFPWGEQLAEANELQICSPTLFLKDTKDESVFFASIMLEARPDFMLFFETVEEVEVWTLFGRKKKKKAVTYDSTGHDAEEVESAIRAFYTDRARLKALIRAPSSLQPSSERAS